MFKIFFEIFLLYLCSMDSALFSRIVKELLADSGKAVVPGFGRFTIEDVPAAFSDRGFTLNPPYRNVIFSLSDERDNAIASLYAKSNDLEITKAEAVVSDFVARLREDLKMSRTLNLPDFGKLRQAGRNCVVFVPEEGLSIFPQFDFLEALSLKSRDFPVAGTENVTDTQPAAATETTPVTQPAAGAEMEPAKDAIVPDNSGEAPGAEEKESAEPSGIKIALITVVVVLLVLILALAVLGRLAPELIDPLLYNEEQLEILHKVL